MDSKSLINALERSLPKELASDLVSEFISIRRDLTAGRLGGSSPGKFVETVVQILQFLETGTYYKEPKVDKYLRDIQNRASTLDDNLRLCLARVARSMYSIRNKRNICHKGAVDPNTSDLQFLHAGAQWIMAEFIRTFDKISMEEAGGFIEQLQVPVGGLIEDFGKRKLVLAEMTAKDEIVVLLHSNYPEYTTATQVIVSLDRRKSDTVRKSLRVLWQDRLTEGNGKDGYKLTRKGLQAAIDIISRFSK